MFTISTDRLMEKNDAAENLTPKHVEYAIDKKTQKTLVI